MPQIMQLTDPDVAVYRPWAWIKLADIGIEGLSEVAINYPSGIDSKFRWLKEFKWYLGENTGSSIEFVIYEDRADWNQIWPSITQDAITQGGSGANGKKVTCQWGYAARKTDGTGLGGFPASDRGTYSSAVHAFYVTGFNIEYAEGGINYRFIGKDAFANVEAVSETGNSGDMTFENAVRSKLRLLEQRGVIPAGYSSNTIFTPEFQSEFKSDVVTRQWEDSGYPWLLTVQKWMTKLASPNNLGRKDFDKKSPRMSPITERGKEGLMFTISRPSDNTVDSLMEIHVNPPESNLPLGRGKHTAINIRPEISSEVLWALAPSVNQLKKSPFRGVVFNNNAGPQLDQGKLGIRTVIPGGSPDDPIQEWQSVEGMRQMAVGGGLGILPVNVDVEILGLPELDKIQYFGETVYLIVWNTAFINDNLQWSRTGLVLGSDHYAGLFDYRFTGNYVIKRISHQITDSGAYTTTLGMSPIVVGKLTDKNITPGS